MIDLLFTTHNRLEYTKASLDTLIENTNWELVDRLFLRDDASKDGTHEYLVERTRQGLHVRTNLVSSQFGGPVAAMNDALHVSNANMIAKIDSDVIVCPRWLDLMLGTLNAHPEIDALGMEPSFGAPPAPLLLPRTVKPAVHIGGVFLARSHVFRLHRPKQDNRFFGWTAFQRRYVRAAWIDPDLPVFLLDHIDVSPWRELAQRYIELGWSRRWESYFTAPPAYYQWWLDSTAGRKMEAAGS